jgi:hypothetical protein
MESRSKGPLSELKKYFSRFTAKRQRIATTFHTIVMRGSRPRIEQGGSMCNLPVNPDMKNCLSYHELFLLSFP